MYVKSFESCTKSSPRPFLSGLIDPHQGIDGGSNPIAELGKPEGTPTRAPMFMRLRVSEEQPHEHGDDLDFRNEILAHIYDKGDPKPKRTLTFTIEVVDEGTRSGLLVQRWKFGAWKKIGRITFTEAVASYNGDFVLHFPHPPARKVQPLPIKDSAG